MRFSIKRIFLTHKRLKPRFLYTHTVLSNAAPNASTTPLFFCFSLPTLAKKNKWPSIQHLTA